MDLGTCVQPTLADQRPPLYTVVESDSVTPQLAASTARNHKLPILADRVRATSLTQAGDEGLKLNGPNTRESHDHL